MAGPINTLGASPDLSLAQLATLIAQQEEVLGPLVSIGNDGSQTLLTFDLDQEPPANHAVIAVGSPLLRGAALVATGKVFVQQALQDVVAFRPA